MTRVRKSALLALAAATIAAGTVLWPAGPISAAAKYDGDWSVVVITEQGTCDRAYRYPVKVVNGSIKYLSEAGITITGRVDGQGRIKASIRRGEQYAEGSGRLSASDGAGTWSGKDRVSECSGRWEAEKRSG